MITSGQDVETLKAEMDGLILQAAAFRGYTDVVKTLLQNGYHELPSGPFGTALHAAALTGNEVILTLLLDSGADVNETAKLSSLHEAVRQLFLSGLSIGTASPLEFTARTSNVQAARLLLDRGARPDAGALRAAYTHGSEQIVAMLLSSEDAELEMESALAVAAGSRHVPIVQQLLDAGTKLTSSHCLSHAAMGGDESIVRLILDAGADVQNTDGLVYASMEGHISVVQLLLDKGANIHHKLSGNTTALEVAKSRGYGEIVTLLEKTQGSMCD